MKKLIALSATLLIAASPLVQAQDSGSGCGLGAVVLEGKTGKGANIAAAILNGIAIPNTFFMTTGGGLMGCDPTQSVKNEEATEIFVASNMDQLSIEAAQGGGEYLNVLAELMGIAHEDKAAFQKIAQQHYDQLFLVDSDAKTMIKSMELAMLNDGELAKYSVN